jgi:hypothetical protein
MKKENEEQFRFRLKKKGPIGFLVLTTGTSV